MPIHQAILLAIVQGFTEFLPISSSAHLALAPWLLGWKDQGLTFDIALHFGTLLAVLAYFFRDWLQIFAQAFKIDYAPDPELSQNPNLLWLLALGSLPIGILGYPLQHYVETTLRSPYVIGTMLILIGLLMHVADKAGKRERGMPSIGLADSLAIGFAQALALVPGTSRSGITMTVSLFRGIDRHAAARYSFLLSTPAIAAAAAKSFYELYKQGGIPADMQAQFIIGMAVSSLVGGVVIAFLLKFLRTNTLRVFVIYRVVFGIIVIALALYLRQPAV